MKFKMIYIFLLLSLTFAQIQSVGSSKFYSDELDGLEFISVYENNQVDRDFHPMVFEFGREYLVNIDVLEQSRIIQDDNETTFLFKLNPFSFFIK